MTPDIVVIDVETACSRVSSICQVGIVGFRKGAEIFEYDTPIDPLDHLASFNARVRGITSDPIRGKPTYGDLHGIIEGHLSERLTVAHSCF